MRRFAIILALVAVGVLQSPPAAAHDQPTYYPARWASSVGYYFTTDFPTGAHRSRVVNGISSWNGLNQTFRFTGQLLDQPPLINPYACTAQPATAIGNWWRNIDGRNNTLGQTVRCVYSDRPQIWSANIIYDSSEWWYTGTGDAPSDPLVCLQAHCGEFDFWSVATHELGHSTGFAGPFSNGHFNPNDSAICSGSGVQTMCPFARIGAEEPRTLETHDRHTFENSY